MYTSDHRRSTTTAATRTPPITFFTNIYIKLREHLDRASLTAA